LVLARPQKRNVVDNFSILNIIYYYYHSNNTNASNSLATEGAKIRLIAAYFLLLIIVFQAANVKVILPGTASPRIAIK
jgi:hypothetical protein